MSLNLIERMDRLPFTKYHRRIWIVCTLAWFFDGFASGVPTYTVTAAFGPLGLNAVTAAFILTAYGVSGVIASFTMSSLADMFGRRNVLQYGVLTYAVGMFCIIFANNYFTFFIFSFIGGLGVSAVLATDNAYLSEFLPPKGRGKMLAWMTNTVPLGGMVPPFLFLLAVGAIPSVPALGWQFIPAVIIVPSLLLFVMRRALPESVRFLISRNKATQADTIVRKLEESAGPEYKYEGPIVMPTVQHRAVARPYLLFSRRYVGVTLLFIAYWFSNSFGVQNFLPTVLNQGLGGASIGAIQTVIVAEFVMIFAMVGRIGATLCMERPGRRFNMVFGPVVAGISALLWAFPFTHRGTVPLWEIVLPALGVNFTNFFSTTWYVASAEMYPVEVRSQAYGWIIWANRATGIINPILVVALLTNQAWLFYGQGIYLLAIALGAFFLIPKNTTGVSIEVSSQEGAYSSQPGAASAQTATGDQAKTTNQVDANATAPSAGQADMSPSDTKGTDAKL